MDYNHITGFLNKFKNLFKNEESKKEIISEVLLKHLAHAIPPDAIKIRKDIIYIQSSPILRSEILMHKSEILLSIKDRIPDCHFTDIR